MNHIFADQSFLRIRPFCRPDGSFPFKLTIKKHVGMILTYNTTVRHLPAKALRSERSLADLNVEQVLDYERLLKHFGHYEVALLLQSHLIENDFPDALMQIVQSYLCRNHHFEVDGKQINLMITSEIFPKDCMLRKKEFLNYLVTWEWNADYFPPPTTRVPLIFAENKKIATHAMYDSRWQRLLVDYLCSPASELLQRQTSLPFPKRFAITDVYKEVLVDRHFPLGLEGAAKDSKLILRIGAEEGASEFEWILEADNFYAELFLPSVSFAVQTDDKSAASLDAENHLRRGVANHCSLTACLLNSIMLSDKKLDHHFKNHAMDVRHDLLNMWCSLPKVFNHWDLLFLLRKEPW